MLEQSILQNYLDILREELAPPLPSASLRATRRVTCRSSPP